MPTRRQFLDRVATSAAAGAAAGAVTIPLALGPLASSLDAVPPPPPGAWDTAWPRRLSGKHRVVFDVAEVESGYGVWRASVWARQYEEVLGVRPRDLSPAVVIRHNAIVLAMRQAFWDEYGIGKAKGVTHPLTLQPTDRNPVLLTDVPAPYDSFALDRLLARGGVALACDLALRDCVELVRARDGVSEAAAREKAVAMLVPGVILQPSGIFAAVLAQDAGCRYVRSS